MSIVIVIPARLASTRLPEKPLVDICGKTMIQRVVEQAKKVRGVSQVIVATDSDKIKQTVENFGARAVLTPVDLASGTDRVAFVAKEVPGKIFINVQGDEPLLDPRAVEGALDLVRSGRFTMSTPAAPIKDLQSLQNPNVVKVLVAADGKAVYFSRFAIPFSRGPAILGATPEFEPRHHMGVYVYTKETLLRFAALARSGWEQGESLEQLRALYHGISIGVSIAEIPSIGVDTQEDLDQVREIIKSGASA